ncbi:MAG: DUF1292 domain-containing protein [Clostridia bacterium]|nr:DUF1292 domain-containing protein [Clostridia bacterium]
MAKDIVNETEDLEDCEIITLENDDGEERDFLHIGTYEYNKEWFVFLQDAEQAARAADDEDAECEVYIYKLVGEGDDEQLFPVEDDDLAETVYNEFIKFMEEE